jgi:hypothetical protein
MSDKKNNKTNLPAINTPDILSLLKDELKSLQAISTTQYKTSGKVEGFPNSIDSETKIENLVRMWASIQGRAKAYTEAQLDLDIKSLPVFKMSDSLPEDFKHDIQLKIKILTHAERKAELEALVKEGESFLTTEDKFKAFQNRVSQAVKK